MMDVFIAYTKQTEVQELGETLEAWDKVEGAEPAAVECQPRKFEIQRRVAAENLASGDYILCDVGYIPTYPAFVEYAEKLLKEHPNVGMFQMKGGVYICRKGVVDKWPEKKSEFYIPEHVWAYQLKGYEVLPCPQVYCRRMGVS